VEPSEEQPTTEITEEPAVPPAKRRRRLWLFWGLGAGVLIVAIGVLLVRPWRGSPPQPTPEDEEQKKIDAEQRQREDQKAAQLRNDPFLVRKEDESQRQLNSLLKELNLGNASGADLPTPLFDRQARAEEEAIAGILRKQDPVTAHSDPPYVPRRTVVQTSQTAVSADKDVGPMFVYSRTFGGAKYVDTPQKQTAPHLEPGSGEKPLDSSPRTTKNIASEVQNRPAEKPTEEKTPLIYTELPPVTLHEGEMLQAVLVNRIIADTEPSPVVCHLAKDLFDHSARYVVLPAGSRIVGVSQVVNYKGAHRLFISFHRIILPNGPSIDLPSSRKALKALDETGALGVVSKVERHWFLQFGTAIFFGVLDGLAGAAQRNRDVFSANSVIIGRTSESFERILESIMAQYSTIVPTIRVDQGKTMKIYLSDDILISPYAKISDRYYAHR
jgi:type IV secretory pathway VirB10-like protein